MKIQGKELTTEKRVRQRKGDRIQILWFFGRKNKPELNEEERKNYETVCEVFGVKKPYEFGASSLLKARIETFAKLVKESKEPLQVEL